MKLAAHAQDALREEKNALVARKSQEHQRCDVKHVDCRRRGYVLSKYEMRLFVELIIIIPLGNVSVEIDDHVFLVSGMD